MEAAEAKMQRDNIRAGVARRAQAEHDAAREAGAERLREKLLAEDAQPKPERRPQPEEPQRPTVKVPRSVANAVREARRTASVALRGEKYDEPYDDVTAAPLEDVEAASRLLRVGRADQAASLLLVAVAHLCAVLEAE